ncbi:MAG: 4'-phosphopantetheinyl transferase superfamily protein [Clostridia bacterium]|nr:4'-phosphopantetheinyl transferase superfamily protein [Clostridia bacterium]
MTSVYFFNLTEKTEYDKTLLPKNVQDHCKKRESVAAATELLNMGVHGLRYEKNNKPVADNCFVSISHSENMVAVCTSENPVGIDIEKIDDTRNFEKIANRYFHGKEKEFFEQNPTADAFYEIWTKKEAYTKIDGNGVIEIQKGFDVLSIENHQFQTEKVNEYMLTICERVK